MTLKLFSWLDTLLCHFCRGHLFLTYMGLFIKLDKYFTGIPNLLVSKEHPKLVMKSTRQVLGVGIVSSSCIFQRA